MSLKCMIDKWLHKGQISQEEYEAVMKKLDGHDKQVRADERDNILNALANFWGQKYAEEFRKWLNDATDEFYQ